MEADEFGAHLRERVGAPEEPAGQRQLFPSAAGASAERRIGPRRSFFISQLRVAALAAGCLVLVGRRKESPAGPGTLDWVSRLRTTQAWPVPNCLRLAGAGRRGAAIVTRMPSLGHALAALAANDSVTVSVT